MISIFNDRRNLELRKNKLNCHQNGINYATHMLEAGEIISVQSQVSEGLNEVLDSTIDYVQCFNLQVSNAVDLSNLVQRIQDERAAIALNIFLDRPVSDDLRDLQLMVSNNVSLRKFTLVKVRNSKFNNIAVILQSI